MRTSMCNAEQRSVVSRIRQGLSALPFVLPAVASAEQMQPIQIFQPPRGSLSFTSLANTFGDLANAVIPFLIGVGIMVVLFGTFKYLTAAGDAEKLAEGRKAALYGVLALFFMVAFWGIVTVVKNSFLGG